MAKQKTKAIDDLLESGQLLELREIITGLDQVSLDRLQKLMTDPHEFALEISDLLPFSIRKLIEKGSINIADLLPFFEEIIQESIQRNPQRLANLLFPIMGPAIRKAVSEDLRKMIESLNKGLESGISPKHLKWRIQALFSRKSYAEIMLSKAYVYHVKHIFLIHKETALLLHQVHDPKTRPIEADIVASMLSAISDFVKDSFDAPKGENVETIKIGETNLWIEEGPYAVIAAVVEGNPPPGLRQVMQEAIEAVHYNHRADLENFGGETAIFEHTEKFLKSCLQSEKIAKKSKPPYFALLLLFVVLAVAGYFLVKHFQYKNKHKALIEAFQNEPGYLISRSTAHDKQLILQGLRDELSRQPQVVASDLGIDFEDVKFKFQHFVSTDSTFVIKRATETLKPPATVVFSFQSGILTISGIADESWANQAKNDYIKVWGVKELRWELTGKNMPKRDLSWIVNDIESYSFIFDFNDIEMNEEQQLKFEKLKSTARLLDEFNHLQNQSHLIQVESFTSKASNEAANTKVALTRAESFMALLNKAGVPAELMKTAVKYNEDIEKPMPVRTVRFKVVRK